MRCGARPDPPPSRASRSGSKFGANTAILSLIHTLMLRLLPVRDPHRPSVPKASIRKSWDTW
jgi:hypothetical protein